MTIQENKECTFLKTFINKNEYHKSGKSKIAMIWLVQSVIHSLVLWKHSCLLKII